MRADVLDTNVLILANGEHDGDFECELACVRLLKHIAAGGIAAVDDAGAIMKEYRENVSQVKPRKAGAQFLVELFNYQHRRDVPITPHPHRGYVQFPTSHALSAFHVKDRKFVAVALTAGSHALTVATDSHFWDARDALAAAGVVLQFVCSHRFGGTRPSR